MQYTLKGMAEAGYVMGLSTIGEVYNHMMSHYDAYFLIANFQEQIAAFDAMVEGHHDDSIELYITEEDKQRMDHELDVAMSNRGNGGW